MSKYGVNEIFCSVQGEGFHLGRLAIFIRFSGCNLGHGSNVVESGDICKFCDTDFQAYTSMTFDEIIEAVQKESTAARLGSTFSIILTGGEPFLQVDSDFIFALRSKFPYATLHVETNGTVGRHLERVLLEHASWFWVSVSPKLGSEIAWRIASEVKVVVPGVVSGEGWTYSALRDLRRLIRARYYWLMPQACCDGQIRTDILGNYTECLVDGWRLGVQAHKVWRMR